MRLSEVLASAGVNGDINPVKINLERSALLGTTDGGEAYIAFRDDEAVAVVLPAIAQDGYNGPIHLLVGIDLAAQSIRSVRTVSHRETPGLGDVIEHSKSNWIAQFNNRSLNDPEPPGWDVRQRGGAFDAATGATVTPAAVIKAVESTLLYFEANNDALLESGRDAYSQASRTLR